MLYFVSMTTISPLALAPNEGGNDIAEVASRRLPILLDHVFTLFAHSNCATFAVGMIIEKFFERTDNHTNGGARTHFSQLGEVTDTAGILYSLYCNSSHR